MTTGTRPATISTALDASWRRSSSDKAQLSPLSPATQIPSTPCPRCQRTSSANASRRSSPDSVNGVTTAGTLPLISHFVVMLDAPVPDAVKAPSSTVTSLGGGHGRDGPPYGFASPCHARRRVGRRPRSPRCCRRELELGRDHGVRRGPLR